MASGFPGIAQQARRLRERAHGNRAQRCDDAGGAGSDDGNVVACVGHGG
jgi:hypothetical protein